MGELLPKAHDMGREFSIISGLGPTAVPVPIAYGYCESPDVTGAHFYVMSQVDGKALFELEDAEEYLEVGARAKGRPLFHGCISGSPLCRPRRSRSR